MIKKMTTKYQIHKTSFIHGPFSSQTTFYHSKPMATLFYWVSIINKLLFRFSTQQGNWDLKNSYQVSTVCTSSTTKAKAFLKCSVVLNFFCFAESHCSALPKITWTLRPSTTSRSDCRLSSEHADQSHNFLNLSTFWYLIYSINYGLTTNNTKQFFLDSRLSSHTEC